MGRFERADEGAPCRRPGVVAQWPLAWRGRFVAGAAAFFDLFFCFSDMTFHPTFRFLRAVCLGAPVFLGLGAALADEGGAADAALEPCQRYQAVMKQMMVEDGTYSEPAMQIVARIVAGKPEGERQAFCTRALHELEKAPPPAPPRPGTVTPATAAGQGG